MFATAAGIASTSFSYYNMGGIVSSVVSYSNNTPEQIYALGRGTRDTVIATAETLGRATGALTGGVVQEFTVKAPDAARQIGSAFRNATATVTGTISVLLALACRRPSPMTSKSGVKLRSDCAQTPLIQWGSDIH
jgi:hypothetical protein